MVPSRLPTNTELALLKIFQEVLGPSEADFGIDTNLIQWGVTSLDIIKLRGHLKRDLTPQYEISIGNILSNPTVRSLAQSLTDTHPPGQQDYSPVVTLQYRGRKVPLWLVHPDNGEIFNYLSLAKHITDRPVYALRARGLDPDASNFSSISEAVTIYHAAIKRYQTHGPYAIAGCEIGASLAFEIRKMLRDTGDEVRFLGVFNSAPHVAPHLSLTDWSLCLLNLALSLGVITEQYSASVAPYFPSLSKGEAVQHIHHAANPSRMTDLSLTGDILAEWADVAFSLQNIGKDYEPNGQVDTIDVFYSDPPDVLGSTSRHDWFADHLSRWQEISKDARFYQLEDSWESILGPESVINLQKALNKVLPTRGV